MSENNGKFLIGVYPGTFDPVTKGHLHMIERASKLVDRLIVAVSDSSRKGPLFTIEERKSLLETDIANMHTLSCEVEVQTFDNLLVDFAKQVNASCIFRGLRATSDFEYEFQMTGMNAKLDSSLETVFLMSAEKWQFVSSSFVKEIASHGGPIKDFITPNVKEALSKKIA